MDTCIDIAEAAIAASNKRKRNESECFALYDRLMERARTAGKHPQEVAEREAIEAENVAARDAMNANRNPDASCKRRIYWSPAGTLKLYLESLWNGSRSGKHADDRRTLEGNIREVACYIDELPAPFTVAPERLNAAN